jgi:hypothetical protein
MCNINEDKIYLGIKKFKISFRAQKGNLTQKKNQYGRVISFLTFIFVTFRLIRIKNKQNVIKSMVILKKCPEWLFLRKILWQNFT